MSRQPNEQGAGRAEANVEFPPLPPRRASFGSPFLYDQQSRIFIVTDVARREPQALATAMRELFLASDGGGRIVRPWLGVSMQRITPDLAMGLGLARPAGLVVKEVFAGGPGEHAGLKRNDVIVGLREHAIDDESSLRFRLATIDVDATVPVRVLRGGQEIILQMKLAAPPEDPPRDKTALDGRQPLSGATVVNLSPAVADERGLAEWRPGIMVIEIQPGSYAARFVRPGDMVVAINGQDVKNVATLKKRIEAGVSSVTISRDGVPQTIQLR